MRNMFIEPKAIDELPWPANRPNHHGLCRYQRRKTDGWIEEWGLQLPTFSPILAVFLHSGQRVTPHDLLADLRIAVERIHGPLARQAAAAPIEAFIQIKLKSAGVSDQQLGDELAKRPWQVIAPMVRRGEDRQERLAHALRLAVRR